MRTRATAIVLGVVTLLVGMLVAGILDQQAVQDIAARCELGANAAPYTKGQNVVLSSESADCDDTGLLTPSTAARASAVIRNAPRAIATTEVRPLATQIAGATEANGRQTRATITSFAGSKPLNDLTPTLVRVVLVIVGVGMIGIGGVGFAGIGPLGRV